MINSVKVEASEDQFFYYPKNRSFNQELDAKGSAE